MAINSTVHVWVEAGISVKRPTEDSPVNIQITEGPSDLVIFFNSPSKFDELIKKMLDFQAKEKRDAN